MSAPMRCVLDSVVAAHGPNYDAARANITVLRQGETLAVMHPEKRIYPAEGQDTVETAIRTNVLFRSLSRTRRRARAWPLDRARLCQSACAAHLARRPCHGAGRLLAHCSAACASRARPKPQRPCPPNDPARRRALSSAGERRHRRAGARHAVEPNAGSARPARFRKNCAASSARASRWTSPTPRSPSICAISSASASRPADSDAQIKQFLVARYGDFILMQPPFEAGTYALWLTPFAVLMVGAGVAIWVVNRARKAPKREA